VFVRNGANALQEWLETQGVQNMQSINKSLKAATRGPNNIPQMNKPVALSSAPATAFYCVSLNPAIDTRLILKGFLPGRVNRVEEVYRTPGGKAAHVAMALKGLGATPTWIGFSGGATGSELIAGLRRLGIETLPISTGQPTRVNLEIVDTREK